jgi:ABC-2 type transport system ATP-binding protein
LLAQGSVADVRALLSRHPRRVELQARDPRRLAERLVAFEDVASVRLEGERLSVETRDIGSFFRALTPVASELRVGLKSVESSDASLEAVFDYLVE